MSTKLSKETHRQQIEAYQKEYPRYKRFAECLERVLKKACADAIPGAIIQARPKSVSSFAEKCVRKADKYPDPVHQLTDLCGARVIVHTLEQVQAVRGYVEANFITRDPDNKSEKLGEGEFGYRDMHYLIQLNPKRAELIDFSEAECREFSGLTAELQVRSIVQHAWADILHDRTYKTPLKLSAEAKRTSALLAAIMEDGDRSFDRLAGEIDSMVANYAAHASRQEVEREIEVQELIFANESNALVGLQLARLLSSCGEYAQVVEKLEPFARVRDASRDAVLLELGYALCQVHREAPKSPDYLRGQHYLHEVITHCASGDFTTVPNLRKINCLHARALSRLAWSWEAVPHAEGKARDCYRKALVVEPTNPYHLANQLGFEIFCSNNSTIIESMRTTVGQAIKTCREHAEAGTELPYAYFTAGRLSLLLGEANQALGWYARGLRHLFDGKSCVSENILEDEVNWVERIHRGADHPPEEHGWIVRLIALGRSFCSACAKESPSPTAKQNDRVLIVAGGVASMDKETLDRICPCLEMVLQNFHGKVISGGTSVGIPGRVGELSAKLKEMGGKNFELVGYIPKNLPQDAPKDANYDKFVVVSQDTGFSAGQILQTWEDLLRGGMTPNQVSVLGFGGGILTQVEFHIGLALGATVAVAAQSGGSADALARDPVWSDVVSLIVLPMDSATMRAFVKAPTLKTSDDMLEKIAREFHAHYIGDNVHSLPPNLHPWEKLSDVYRVANYSQASYVEVILQAAGFGIRPAQGGLDVITSFKEPQHFKAVERMAELEHGRWNIERLRQGWRYGRQRNNEKKIHPCLVTWKDLPEPIREYDRNAIRAFPEILAMAGMEIYRK